EAARARTGELRRSLSDSNLWKWPRWPGSFAVPKEVHLSHARFATLVSLPTRRPLLVSYSAPCERSSSRVDHEALLSWLKTRTGCKSRKAIRKAASLGYLICE